MTNELNFRDMPGSCLCTSKHGSESAIQKDHVASEDPPPTLGLAAHQGPGWSLLS
jgi:hypothetical protein